MTYWPKHNSPRWLHSLSKACAIMVVFCGSNMAAFAVDAKAIEVTSTGQAFPTGVGSKDLLRRRALEAALYEASSAGGTDVLGFSASDMAVMVSEQLVVRPASRILDYQILSEGMSGDFYRVKIRALVGDVTPAATYCARKAQLDVTGFVPIKLLSPNAPAWAGSIINQVAERLDKVLEKNASVNLTHAVTQAPVKQNKAKNDMDYMALTQGTAGEIASYALGYTAQIEIGLPRSGTVSAATPALELRITSRLLDGASHSEKSKNTFTKTAVMSLKTPFSTLNVLSRKNQAKYTKELTDGLEAHVEDLINTYACRPLTGKLERAGNSLILPLGRADGLTKAHIAYTEGKDQAYNLLDITDLKAHSITLRPLNQSLSVEDLAGVQVRFMETK